MKKKENLVFVHWQKYHTRTATLAIPFGASIKFVDNLINTRGMLWKLLFWIDYTYKCVETIIFLTKQKPTHVFAVSGPSFCPMICWIYCKFTGARFYVDAHNGTFSRQWISVPFFLNVLRSAEAVIVHNKEFHEYLLSKYTQLNFFILPDKIPKFKDTNKKKSLDNSRYFLVPLSYSDSDDEPLEEILTAVKKFIEKYGNHIRFKFTGNYPKKANRFRKYMDIGGIEFLGYVEKAVYDQLVIDSMGIIALTTKEKVQQCASIEAMGAGKPLIVSNTDTNRRIFFKGAIVTDTAPESIFKSIETVIENRENIQDEMQEINRFWEDRWWNEFKEVERLIKQT